MDVGLTPATSNRPFLRTLSVPPGASFRLNGSGPSRAFAAGALGPWSSRLRFPGSGQGPFPDLDLVSRLRESDGDELRGVPKHHPGVRSLFGPPRLHENLPSEAHSCTYYDCLTKPTERCLGMCIIHEFFMNDLLLYLTYDVTTYPSSNLGMRPKVYSNDFKQQVSCIYNLGKVHGSDTIHDRYTVSCSVSRTEVPRMIDHGIPGQSNNNGNECVSLTGRVRIRTVDPRILGCDRRLEIQRTMRCRGTPKTPRDTVVVERVVGRQ